MNMQIHIKYQEEVESLIGRGNGDPDINGYPEEKKQWIGVDKPKIDHRVVLVDNTDVSKQFYDEAMEVF